MKRFLALSLILSALSCKRAETPAPAAPAAPVTQAATHQEEVMKWRDGRLTRLKSEDGWLSLVGLHWLRSGENRFGSDKSNEIVLPAKAPASAGVLTLKDGRITLTPKTEMMIDKKLVTAPVQLFEDTSEKGPTIVQLGTIKFQVIKRGERFALRVKDAESETRTHFAGIDYYPIDSKWRIAARLEPYNPPKKIPITDITGMTADNESPGALVFTLDGKEHRIDPLGEGEQLFIIFKDETSGTRETYPAGRYLYADMPGPDGKVIIDFNRAYNPPCAFTDYATCPLPPPQNRLPLRVEAGEKAYKGGHA